MNVMFPNPVITMVPAPTMLVPILVRVRMDGGTNTVRQVKYKWW